MGSQRKLSINLTLSDGHRTLISRAGRRLYMTRRPGGITVASRPFQPQPASGLPPLDWQEVPDNSYMVIERRKGDIKVRQSTI